MIIVQVEKLVYGGAGLCESEGKKIFVDFSAPGDTLDINITKDHGQFSEAEIVKIVEPSRLRVEPKCPVFGRCGGCQWQHLSYQSQLSWKQKILKETIERVGGALEPEVLPTLPSPKEWYYRNRIQLHSDGKGHAGFYKPRSNEIVEFQKCYIADERINEMLCSQRKEIGCRQKGMSLRLFEGPHFSQVNVEQNENVKKVIKSILNEVPHEIIVELYAGSGNFTFSMAEYASRVIASEIDGRAIRFAKDWVEQSKIKNVEFHCIPSEKISKVFNSKCDVVFLNPPRKGAAESIEPIIGLDPKTVIYMSCNPATLSRDLKRLIAKGWRLKKCLPIDMFPQTFHIEAIAVLSK